MKITKPDFTGEVAADEQFCGECGRSLAPAAVAAAKAGMVAGGQVPGAGRVTPVIPPLIAAVPPPTPAYAAPAGPPGAAAPARSARLPWILGGAIGTVLLSIVCCVGTVLWINSNVTPTPTPGVIAQTFQFTLDDLTPDNSFKMAQDVRGATGDKLGVLSLNANYSYEKLGSPDLIGTVELRVNNNVVLELAASNQPEYATSNPRFEVATEGKTYTVRSAEGWSIRATVNALTIDEQPTLGNGQTGKQPVFAGLDLLVEVIPAP
jgi:hypothetical protein